jgi:putative transposase
MRVLSRPVWAVDSTIKGTSHAVEQIIRKLKTAEPLIAQGKTVADVCRVIEVTQPTYHRLRQQYRGIQAEEAWLLTQLQTLSTRLKKLLADAELEKAMPKNLAEGNFRAQNAGLGPSRSCRSITGHPSGWSAVWWARTAAPNVTPARSSRSRRKSCAIVSK